jgi:hypothetical protein
VGLRRKKGEKEKGKKRRKKGAKREEKGRAKSKFRKKNAN